MVTELPAVPTAVSAGQSGSALGSQSSGVASGLPTSPGGSEMVRSLMSSLPGSATWISKSLWAPAVRTVGFAVLPERLKSALADAGVARSAAAAAASSVPSTCLETRLVPLPLCPLSLILESNRGLLARRRNISRSAIVGRRFLVRLGLDRVRPAHLLRGIAHADHLRRHAPDDRVRRDVAGDDGVRADDGVVPDSHAAQEARAVADPDVGADHALARVDALHPDGALDLDHAVIEVDEHRPVGDHALLTDPHPLVRRDRAFLSHHGLRADLDDPLVAADLGAVPDPGEAAESDLSPLGDLELQGPPEENRPIGLPPPAGRGQEPAPEIAPEQAAVAPVEHAVAAVEAERAEHGRGV